MRSPSSGIQRRRCPVGRLVPALRAGLVPGRGYAGALAGPAADVCCLPLCQGLACHPQFVLRTAPSCWGGDGIDLGLRRQFPRPRARGSKPCCATKRAPSLRNDVTEQQVEGIADGIAKRSRNRGRRVKEAQELGPSPAVWLIGSKKTGRPTTTAGSRRKAPFDPEMERWAGMVLGETAAGPPPSACSGNRGSNRRSCSRKSGTNRGTAGFRRPDKAGRSHSGCRRGCDQRGASAPAMSSATNFVLRRGRSRVRNRRDQPGRRAPLSRRLFLIVAANPPLPLAPTRRRSLLQGRLARRPASVGARQDCAESHQRLVGEEAARVVAIKRAPLLPCCPTSRVDGADHGRRATDPAPARGKARHTGDLVEAEGRLRP